jgi:hypothetical protein
VNYTTEAVVKMSVQAANMSVQPAKCFVIIEGWNVDVRCALNIIIVIANDHWLSLLEKYKLLREQRIL